MFARWVVSCQLWIVSEMVVSGTRLESGLSKTRHEEPSFVKTRRAGTLCSPNEHLQVHDGASVDTTCLRESQESRPVWASEGSHSGCPFELAVTGLFNGQRRAVTIGALMCPLSSLNNRRSLEMSEDFFMLRASEHQSNHSTTCVLFHR